MKAKTNTDYYNIMLEGCKESFENIELKEYLYTNEAMNNFNEYNISKESIEQIGINNANDLKVNYRTNETMTRSFLNFLDRQQTIFEKKHLVPRNEFYQRCLNVINIKRVELFKENENRILTGVTDLGNKPDPFLFIECLKHHIENRSLEPEKTKQNEVVIRDNDLLKTQTKPPKPKKQLKDFFNSDVEIEIIEKIQNEFKGYYGKKMAVLIYLLQTDFKIISYSLDSKTDGRKHFVDSLNNSKPNMQPINKCFITHTYKLDITNFTNDIDYMNIKEKLLKTIKKIVV